jgi:hypothetical protein
MIESLLVISQKAHLNDVLLLPGPCKICEKEANCCHRIQTRNRVQYRIEKDVIRQACWSDVVHR